ncbi:MULTISPECIES: DUF4097 family beta strand repeat-containing protein [unclassified Pseudactinotalea]|uniref:DUF4097 family beta strand repeat-containing protein n=1 Tax=Micrococcales TaxID=85006 RepID=UPI003C7E2D58
MSTRSENEAIDMTQYAFAVTGPVRVHAGTRSSDLTITAADTAEATVRLKPHRENSTGRAYAEDTLVEFNGDVLNITVPRAGGLFFGSTPRLDIEVQVPPGSDIEVFSGSGDLTARGTVGSVQVRTGSGDVYLEQAGAVKVSSGSGDVVVDSLTDGGFKSGSGDLRLGRASGHIEFNSGSGDLIIESATDVVSTTASGDSRIGELAGTARIRSASGDLEVRKATHGTINASSASGDVTVAVPAGTPVFLDCSSTSGHTKSTLAATRAPDSDEQVLTVEARSISGDIHITNSR